MNITRVLSVGTAAVIGVAVVGTALSSSAGAGDGGATHATATIVDVSGATSGFARFTEDAQGRVHVNVKVAGLTPGIHGIHVHGVARAALISTWPAPTTTRSACPTANMPVTCPTSSSTWPARVTSTRPSRTSRSPPGRPGPSTPTAAPSSCTPFRTTLSPSQLAAAAPTSHVG